MTAFAVPRPAHRVRERIDWLRSIPFFAVHVACLGVVWVGVSAVAVGVCALLYVVRMFGITAGYHRYFSHRSFRTSRSFQFVLAVIGAAATQKGPLWWAAHHRHHHAASDTENDPHSPHDGFWWSHVGWFLCPSAHGTRYAVIPDLMRFPELVFLDRFHLVPPVALAAGTFAFGWLFGPDLGTSGLQMLVWGYFISTVLLYHATFVINSLAHVFGTRRFPTKDDSRNNFLLAVITLGEGWHNNHHYAPSSERQGFFWWEVDVAHYMLTVLSWAGLVRDLKTPPRRALLYTPCRKDQAHVTSSDSPLHCGSSVSPGGHRGDLRNHHRQERRGRAERRRHYNQSGHGVQDGRNDEHVRHLRVTASAAGHVRGRG
jgi:stearoyl-CoA desaturase (delta-9 desaturase)